MSMLAEVWAPETRSQQKGLRIHEEARFPHFRRGFHVTDDVRPADAASLYRLRIQKTLTPCSVTEAG